MVIVCDALASTMFFRAIYKKQTNKTTLCIFWLQLSVEETQPLLVLVICSYPEKRNFSSHTKEVTLIVIYFLDI